MNKIKNIIKIILENDSHDLIIPKGTKLFHGTVEDFEKEKIEVGIDGVFWTSLNKKISSSYIPVASSMVYTSSRMIAKPSNDTTTQNIQKMFGIEYKDVHFDEYNRVKSYKIADVFKDIHENEYVLNKKLINVERTIKELNKKYREQVEKEPFDEKELRNILEQLQSLEKEEKELKDKYYEINTEKIENEYVNTKLQELGYIPSNENDYNKNFRWKLKLKNYNLVPNDYKETGRLLTVIPKRDLKIYDMTQGEKIESDLTDLQYKKYDLFKKIENMDYDGLKISDYAQHETHGNVGHYSIGLFEKTLKDVDIEEEKASHPDDF